MTALSWRWSPALELLAALAAVVLLAASGGC